MRSSELVACRPHAICIRRALDPSNAECLGIQRNALRAAILFASTTAIQATEVYRRNGEDNAAILRYRTWIKALQIELKDAGVSAPDRIAEQTFRLGYFLHFLPRQFETTRRDLSADLARGMTFEKWLWMTEHLEDGSEPWPRCPRRYIGYLRTEAKRLMHNDDFADDREGFIRAIASYQVTVDRVLSMNVWNWQWMTIEVINDQLSASTISRRKQNWLRAMAKDLEQPTVS